MPKFTASERMLIQNIVCNLSIKRIPDNEIIKEVYEQTKKTISKVTLFNVRKRVKKESFHWYSKLREGEYEYFYEFKERISEIMDLQKKLHSIIDNNKIKPSTQIDAISELHKLNVTLFKYYDIIPSLTAAGHRQTGTGIETETQRTGIRISQAGHRTRMPLAENCQCILNGMHTDTVIHIECRYCLQVWCAKAIPQDWCPNPQCKHGIRGIEFEPYDEDYKWIKCNCGMWFQKQEILDAHLAAYPHNSNDNV